MANPAAKTTLLIVEDSPVIGTLVRKVLERLGPHIHLAAALHGKQGIELAKKEKPQLILLDWMMPEFDGEYFLQEQVKFPEIANIPVFVHTAIKEEELKNIIKNYPVVKSFIRKPIVPSKLFEKIKCFIDEYYSKSPVPAAPIAGQAPVEAPPAVKPSAVQPPVDAKKAEPAKKA